MRLLKAYMFRTKDPCIDQIKTIAQDRFGKRNLAFEQFETIANDGGPTASTLNNWFNGDTRRPQNATLEAAGRALGMQRIWVPMKNGKARP